MADMQTIHLTVVVDTTELRVWADKLADAGIHGPAHVLYQAAAQGESLTEQAIREAKADAWDEGHRAGRVVTTNPYRKIHCPRSRQAWRLRDASADITELNGLQNTLKDLPKEGR